MYNVVVNKVRFVRLGLDMTLSKIVVRVFCSKTKGYVL